MQKDTKKYAIYWQPISKDSDIAKRFKVPIDITLPFFLDEEDSFGLEHRDKITATDYDLLVGLLVEYFTSNPLIYVHEMRTYFRSIIWDLLELFQDQYGHDPIERFILVICADLKDKYGEAVSRRAFRTGLEIFPEILKLIDKPSQDS